MAKKPEKKEEKKPKESKKKQGEDFKYRLRLAGFILDGNQNLVKALTGIKGVGRQTSYAVIKSLNMETHRKLGTLEDDEVTKIEETLKILDKKLPPWMLNRQKDPYSGENKHVIGSDLEMANRDDILKLRKIKAYRGVRHSIGLPVRGQRTRTSFRKGTTVGVSRRKTK
ncbi:MAG: 30S ribosomal protein S13 [Candidatus Altiarchaeales archaeon ex4484_96]|nr:MAG: 30S ribosomal protein S13 [Candidatus Altiarchaeales archaeon ex4484_96]